MRSRYLLPPSFIRGLTVRAIDYYLEQKHPCASSCGHSGLELDSQRDVSLYFVVGPDRSSSQTFVRLTFSPLLTEHCKFVYHYYKIHVSVQGKPARDIPSERRLEIVKSTQHAYESVDFRHGKYPFRFNQDEFVPAPLRE